MKKLWKIFQQIDRRLSPNAKKSTRKMNTSKNCGKYSRKSIDVSLLMQKSPLEKGEYEKIVENIPANR